MANKPLYTGAEWTIEAIDKTWKVIDKIGKDVFKLDYYEPQLELITYEQMLNAYSSVGMPLMYYHWSYGKSFIQNDKAYKSGKMGLAYEMVINTDPMITYLMEDNTMTLQTLVMAHAVCGHGSFFKNNYLFKEWTDADAIVDYLKFAKSYVESCEEKYGADEVEAILDSCHTIQMYGVDKYRRPQELKTELREKRIEQWQNYVEEQFNDIWRTLPKAEEAIDITPQQIRTFPEENLLYFIEKNSPKLKSWQKEIVRIVRKIAQYFYPQGQTKLMNEGWATFIHYHIMQELHHQGYITDGSYLEFIDNHSGVCCQPNYSNINVYALGFAMFQDIKRICLNPTEEDKRWFPDLRGKNWMEVTKDIVENYRDESFVLQFLSPKVIRDFKLYQLNSVEETPHYATVEQVHDDEGYMELRDKLSKQYSYTYRLPQIEITDVNLKEDRILHLQHKVYKHRLLDYNDTKKTLKHIRRLWGFPVMIDYVDSEGNEIDEV